MAEDNVQRLADRLVADAELRERFRSDPVGVVEENDIELDDEHRERLTSENWAAVSDEEVQTRMRGDDAGFWF